MNAEAPTSTLPERDFWRDGLDKGFFNRLYLRGSQVGAIAFLAALGLDQRTIALGIGCGLVVALTSTWSVEMMVRLLFRGGDPANAGWKLAIGALVKLPLMLLMMAGIAWGSYRGFINVFAVVGGVMLVHLTMGVLAIGASVAQVHRNSPQVR